MDLVIETLTGTVFELRVSPFETIMSVKARIQRLEGIPMSQQHLIWRSIELEDDYCLHDYNIQDGTTLKLVLAMRGGPINTRRVSLEDPTLQEMAEYMEANREDIWDKLMKDNQQVTLLVFRDGDQINFFRVYDRGDGTLTPMSETLSATSMYNMYEEGEEVTPEISRERQKENDETKTKMELIRSEMAKVNAKKKQEREKENNVTKEKMEVLRSEMEKLNIRKHKPIFQPRPPSTEKPAGNLAKRRLKFSEKISSWHMSAEGNDEQRHSEALNQVPELGKKSLPPVTVRGRKTNEVDISDIMAVTNKDSQIIQDLNKSGKTDLKAHNPVSGKTEISDLLRRRNDSSRRLARRISKDSTNLSKSSIAARSGQTSTQRGGEFDTEGSLSRVVNESPLISRRNSSKALHELMNRRSVADSDTRNSTTRTVTPDEVRDSRTLGHLYKGSKEYRDYKALISWIRPKSDANPESPSKEGKKKRFDVDSGRKSSIKHGKDSDSASRKRMTPEEIMSNLPRVPGSSRIVGDGSNYILPPVSGKKRPPQLVPTGRRKTRCTLCAKKLGLATSYQCRCGNLFCASHRYAETHNCTYDYKAEGKKVLEQTNPLVVAPKLPKI